MKILHTSDWHLGKRLGGKSRLNEQREVLMELADVLEKEKVDLLIVAGDIFDTSVPSSEAEELFYESALKLTRVCPMIALAGNHDDADRLAAPNGIARFCDLALIGGLDNSAFKTGTMAGGYGCIDGKIGGEEFSIALLPFPSDSRMDKLIEQDKTIPYAERVQNLLKLCADHFSEEKINLTVSHLFMADSESSDEITLGTALMLPKSILPHCHYTALGHIHKPQTVSKSNNVYYSGSILNYSFDDLSAKSFIIADISAEGVKEVKRVSIKGGKRLTVRKASCVEEAEIILREWSGYVLIQYESTLPLTAADMSKLKSYPSYAAIQIAYDTGESVIKSGERVFKKDDELFCDYYQSLFGKAPERAVTELFLDILNKENI